ncbi:MAG: TonB-dependent receptor [Rhodothermales bacterium]|jgi:iron complex outermembrane receptor protein
MPFRYVPLLLALLLPVSASAQPTPADTLVRTLGDVTVTAERVPVEAARAAAAVSVITAEEVERQPLLNLADALRLTPGFAFLNGDGAGTPPAATVRGFYGGGEAEYVLLLVDGRPVNDVETGLVDWELVPLGSVERVEVLRGGASPLWGDAAIGAVVNVVTDGGPQPVQISASGGSNDTYFLSGSGSATWRGRAVSAYGSVKRYGGWRDHAERTVGLAGARAEVLRSERGSLALSTRHSWTDADLPGPLLGPALADGRTPSSPFYRFDGTEERRHRLALDGRWEAVPGLALDGGLFGGWRSAEITRTLPLSPEFGDTKRRDLDGGRVEMNLQATAGGLGAGDRTLGLPLPTRVVVGATGSLQTLESAYRPVLVGTAEDYADAEPDLRAEAEVSGDGSRRALALYAQAEAAPVAPLRLVLGARFDWLGDRYDAVLPEPGETETTHTAFSPRVGANLRWIATDRQVGHAYAQATRSFKAPTLDQLFDQRLVGVPFPPFTVSLSNADLQPQRGTTVEAGLRHRAELVPGRLAAEAEVTLYQIDMEDEIDFSLQEFAYLNLGESRHRGVETGLSVLVGERARLFGTYTYTEATVENGDFAGNVLKAIPRDVWAAGASATRGRLSGSVVVRGAGRIWLDDANTIPLDPWTVFDAKLALRLPLPGPAATLTAEAFNLLDAGYSTTGFPDASGTPGPDGGPLVYYYPAAGRQLRLGLRATL